MRTNAVRAARTYEGGPAYSHDDKSALFLLGAGRFFGESAFYESADAGAQRFVQLARRVAVGDPIWFANFVRWLRQDGNIRTAAIVAAAQGADAWLQAGLSGTRPLVNSAIVRADEPGEFVAYWRANIRRALPGGVQRALQDSIQRLYTERNQIKFDSQTKDYRFADVVDTVHANPINSQQALLFKYLLDERHHQDGKLDGLGMLTRYKQVQKALATDRASVLANPDMLRGAGMTWENLSSSGPMDAKAWEAIVPQMGFMALLRNLRNFEQANMSLAAKKKVAERIGDEEEVARSRQLPYRFLSAYLEAQDALWQPALEKAIQASLNNIPQLPGKTLVLVDTSSSMGQVMSAKSKITAVQAGALFGVALAAAQDNAVLIGFANGPSTRSGGYAGNNPFVQQISKGAAVLRTVDKFCSRIGENGHGTEVVGSIQWALQMHPDADRVVVVSDMQTMGRGMLSAPGVTMYGFNMSGYGTTPIESTSTQHQLGGLTDQTFGLIKVIEESQQGAWPWEK